MTIFEQVREVLGSTLQLGARTAQLVADTPLFGAIPELDSTAVVQVLTALEERLDIVIADDEITGEAFATVGSLVVFVSTKL